MPPSQDVQQAFGAAADPRPLDGGQGQTWLAGTIVLKPASMAAEARWRASVLDALPAIDGLRIARPVRAASGDWLHNGWEAWQHVAGGTDPTRCNDALRAGAAFHEAIAALDRPDFLDSRDNWWSHADRAAWNLDVVEESPILRRLMEARTPVAADQQLVHGDLLGNVLYEPGQPPAIIDWAPYWRPAPWAAAVAVIDALCWHGADGTLIEQWSSLPNWTQMLLRALLFRMPSEESEQAFPSADRTLACRMMEYPETLYPSLTPLAVQARWKIPTEFPSCPDEFTDDGLMLYASRLSFGTVFAQNDYSTSLIVEHRLRDDDLIVLTRFAEEAIKDWAVAHISILDGHFLHRSEFTFHTLQGALKHFCALAEDQFEQSMDDYC